MSIDYVDAAYCNLISLGVQPSEIDRMEWRTWMKIYLGRVIAEQQDEPEHQLSQAEERAAEEDAFAILTGGPAAPEAE